MNDAKQFLLKVFLAYIGLEIFLVFIAPNLEMGVERQRYYSKLRPPQLAESIVQWQTVHTLTNAKPYDVIFLGDSSCLMGLVPKSFNEETGLKSLNICTTGWLYIDGHVELLDLYLSHATPPKYLVYYFATSSFADSYNENEKRGHLTQFRNWMRLPGRDWYTYLPTYHLRGYLRYYLEEFARDPRDLDMRPKQLQLSDSEVRDLIFRNEGYLPEINREPMRENSYSVRNDFHPDAMPGFVKLMKVADKHGIKVLFVTNPLPDVAKNDITQKFFDKYKHDLVEGLEGHRFEFVEEPLRTYRNAFFGSLNHLTEEGAKQNTLDVAKIFNTAMEPKN